LNDNESKRKNVKEKIVKERNKRKDMCMCLESKRKDMYVFGANQ
jgi:hypothetical protein